MIRWLRQWLLGPGRDGRRFESAAASNIDAHACLITEARRLEATVATNPLAPLRDFEDVRAMLDRRHDGRR